MSIEADQLRDRMRADLLAARKARDADAVTALRTALAELDNAEAVAPSAIDDPGSEHVAGATAGVGSSEAERRELALPQVRALLRSQVEERTTEAARYDDLGRPDDAERLRREAAALGPYLA